MKMTVQEIKASILQSGLTRDELVELNQTVVRCLNINATAAAASFSKNDKVYFVGKHGNREEGTVIKVNTKTVIVQVGFTRWSVSPSFLKRVGE